jgi:hypothetical protein
VIGPYLLVTISLTKFLKFKPNVAFKGLSCNISMDTSFCKNSKTKMRIELAVNFLYNIQAREGVQQFVLVGTSYESNRIVSGATFSCNIFF